jgi:intermediate cleaving peptidase 55
VNHHLSLLSTEKDSSPRGFRAILYSAGKDRSKEKWDGASTGFADVVALFGADDARPLDNFANDLRALLARAEHVYVDLPPAPSHHNRHTRHHRRRVVGAATAGTRFPSFFKYLARQPQPSSFDEDHAETGSYVDVIAASMSKRKPLAPLVGALRSVKSECEVQVMKASAEISARAHAKVSLGSFLGALM